MKHLIINSFGVFLGLKSQRLVVYENKIIKRQIALKTLKTIQIKSKGVSISSDLVIACSIRGIKIFFENFNTFASLHGLYEHKGVKILKNQFQSEQNSKDLLLAKEFIMGKIKNQRSTLLYFSRNKDLIAKDEIINSLQNAVNFIKFDKNITKENLFGIEGNAANEYFEFLKLNELLPASFIKRTKQNSREITNICLNYGYAILANFIYKSVINAGLNPYFGVLHSMRSAKPSLVLDIMEEYRSFVVDRNIIKLRANLVGEFDYKIKKLISQSILDSISKKFYYNKKRFTLESIMQRQIYKISGFFAGNNKYKSYIFRW